MKQLGPSNQNIRGRCLKAEDIKHCNGVGGGLQYEVIFPDRLVYILWKTFWNQTRKVSKTLTRTWLGRHPNRGKKQRDPTLPAHRQPLQRVIPRNKINQRTDIVVLRGCAAASAQFKSRLPLSSFSWASAKGREENLSRNNNDPLLEWKGNWTSPLDPRGAGPGTSTSPHPACHLSSSPVPKGWVTSVAERAVCLHSPFYQALRWGCQPEGQGISKGAESSDLIKTPYRKYAWLECIGCENGEGERDTRCIGKGSFSAFAQLLAPVYRINTQTTRCLLEWEIGAKHFITTNWKISAAFPWMWETFACF